MDLSQAAQKSPEELEGLVFDFAHAFDFDNALREQLRRNAISKFNSTDDLNLVIGLAGAEVLFDRWSASSTRYRALNEGAEIALVESRICTIVQQIATYLFERHEGGALRYLRDCLLHIANQRDRRPRSRSYYVTLLHRPTFELLQERWRSRR